VFLKTNEALKFAAHMSGIPTDGGREWDLGQMEGWGWLAVRGEWPPSEGSRSGARVLGQGEGMRMNAVGMKLGRVPVV
jgi:hypothetical protein